MTLDFVAAWSETASYSAGAEVIHAGRAWRAQRATSAGERPGRSDAWLAVTGTAKGRPVNPMMGGRR